MSEAVGIESFTPIDLFIRGLAAGFFMLGFYGALYYLIIKCNSELSKPITLLGFISYVVYLYFSWSFCTPAFQIFSDMFVKPLSFVIYATLVLIYFR